MIIAYIILYLSYKQTHVMFLNSMVGMCYDISCGMFPKYTAKCVLLELLLKLFLKYYLLKQDQGLSCIFAVF